MPMPMSMPMPMPSNSNYAEKHRVFMSRSMKYAAWADIIHTSRYDASTNWNILYSASSCTDIACVFVTCLVWPTAVYHLSSGNMNILQYRW